MDRTYWSRASMVVTALTVVMMAGAALAIYIVDRDAAVWSIALIAVLVTMCVTALYNMPTGVRLDDETLTVVFPCRSRDFRLSEIAEARPYTDVRHMWRICGSGAFFGWWGWFRAKGIGRFMLYAANQGQMLLIELNDGRKYMISCSDPAALCQRMRQLGIRNRR